MAKIVEIKEIPLDALVIGKGQVRVRDVGKDIEELASSIKKQGLLHLAAFAGGYLLSGIWWFSKAEATISERASAFATSTTSRNLASRSVSKTIRHWAGFRRGSSILFAPSSSGKRGASGWMTIWRDSIANEGFMDWSMSSSRNWSKYWMARCQISMRSKRASLQARTWKKQRTRSKV